MNTVTIQLAADDAQTLAKILEYHLSELRMEIAGTDRGAFRDELHKREDVINKILAVLPKAQA